MISLIGLVFILIGWIVQLVVMKTDRKVNPIFVLFYIAGTIMIAYEDFFRGWVDLSVANVLIMLVAIVVFVISISERKRVNFKKK